MHNIKHRTAVCLAEEGPERHVDLSIFISISAGYFLFQCLLVFLQEQGTRRAIYHARVLSCAGVCWSAVLTTLLSWSDRSLTTTPRVFSSLNMAARSSQVKPQIICRSTGTDGGCGGERLVVVMVVVLKCRRLSDTFKLLWSQGKVRRVHFPP